MVGPGTPQNLPKFLKEVSFIFLSVPVGCFTFFRVCCAMLLFCAYFSYNGATSLPFSQFLLPGFPHRCLLLRQLLRCQCHNLLACNQPPLVLQRCNHISLPFCEFPLPGGPHRSLLLRQQLRCQCHNLLACNQPHLVLQRCNHISLPFCQFLLPGCPHRSLLLHQQLRYQCYNLLACNQPHLVLCSLSLCRRRLLPRKRQGGHSETTTSSIGEPRLVWF
ncbi:hypothetical protein MRX96_007198 [Rhipicephalus microplus]